jgi:RNA ligase (TIGR02306 family)
MSIFAVSLERIARVWPHDNADRLAMAQLDSMSYQFVIVKDTYQVGDLVVYFPIDSVLPPQVITAIGLEGKLSGAERNRVKTIKLRGAISQGVVANPFEVIPDWAAKDDWHEGQDVTALLGVTRYEAQIVPSQGGNLVSLPDLVSVYDIESAERFAAQVEAYLLDQAVLISEKVEGSHWSISLYADGSTAVCQRRYRIEPIEGVEHDWHKVARTSGISAQLPALKVALEAHLGRALQGVTVRGELIGPGVQGNYYKLRDHTVRIFEIEVDSFAVDVADFLALAAQFNLPTVPILAQNVTLRAWLEGRALAVASNGKSALNVDLLREGVVIRPMVEVRDDAGLGRVIIKQRSPEYLADNDA